MSFSLILTCYCHFYFPCHSIFSLSLSLSRMSVLHLVVLNYSLLSFLARLVLTQQHLSSARGGAPLVLRFELIPLHSIVGGLFGGTVAQLHTHTQFICCVSKLQAPSLCICCWGESVWHVRIRLCYKLTRLVLQKKISLWKESIVFQFSEMLKTFSCLLVRHKCTFLFLFISVYLFLLINSCIYLS